MTCNNGYCQKPNCGVVKSSCNTDNDCCSSFFCTMNQCFQTICSSDSDCPSPLRCGKPKGFYPISSCEL
jgi:hypothetical protein